MKKATPSLSADQCYQFKRYSSLLTFDDFECAICWNLLHLVDKLLCKKMTFVVSFNFLLGSRDPVVINAT